ncbi:cobalamin-dependent protein [Metabacillus fastidiosus]|uniref:cobalamin B12-binding domain-containing protein n=1 Tax=Metabacillus fastidiosus TaxID=1458 RepID=UPI002E221806|nr:cobalamin-dependent protein [Metabacillus fastidiosus]MED4533269.1 cobalamin-dependent protein [Metabacillus fastidiosus]
MYDIKQLASFLLDGDSLKVWEYIQKNKRLSLHEIYENMITPAMRYIGFLWENNEITVADEHLATATCDFVLSKLGYNVEKIKLDQKAMFLCLEGEQHYIGLKMVNNLFEEHGWETKYFGPNLPLEYALTAALEWKPNVIGLSVSIVHYLPKLKEYIAELVNLPHKPEVLIGGRLAAKYNLVPYCTDNTIILTDLLSTKEWLKNYHMGGKRNAAL